MVVVLFYNTFLVSISLIDLYKSLSEICSNGTTTGTLGAEGGFIIGAGIGLLIASCDITGATTGLGGRGCEITIGGGSGLL
jgi:hypothetical protein